LVVTARTTGIPIWPSTLTSISATTASSSTIKARNSAEGGPEAIRYDRSLRVNFIDLVPAAIAPVLANARPPATVRCRHVSFL